MYRSIDTVAPLYLLLLSYDEVGGPPLPDELLPDDRLGGDDLPITRRPPLPDDLTAPLPGGSSCSGLCSTSPPRGSPPWVGGSDLTEESSVALE